MPKILVIEDDRSIRVNTIEVLQAEGFDVFWAENGQVGLQRAKEHLPDIIVCDIIMPKLDGFQVLQALSEHLETQTIPFIFLTARSERSDFRQGMESGAQDYLTKPFTNQELLGAIHAQLKKRDLVAQHYKSAVKQINTLKQKIQELQQVTNAKAQLLNNLIEELREPIANISMSIQMLKEGMPSTQRDRYLKVLQEEFAREIALLNQVSELQEFLTPTNIKLLRQFNLLKESPGNISL